MRFFTLVILCALSLNVNAAGMGESMPGTHSFTSIKAQPDLPLNRVDTRTPALDLKEKKEALDKKAKRKLMNTTSPKAYTYKDLSKEEQKLLEAAAKVMENSYNPYSHFHVGSALLAKDGSVITGTNFENAAYGSTICAERTAIFKANADGKRKFTTIAIIGRGHDFDVDEPVAPCGACRQVIFEASQISDENIKVIMSNTKKTKIYISTIQELLPLAFGPKDLGIEL